MFKSLLRFVGIIAFMGVFTSSAFAVNCIDRTTNRSRAATSNEYVGANNYCSACGYQKGTEDPNFEWSNIWLGMIKECGNGVFKCNPGSFKAEYYYDTYYCYPCPYASSDNITPSGSPSRPDYFSWKDGDEACVAYDTNVGEHCTGTREWRPVGTCWWGSYDSGGVNSVPYLNGTANAYSFQASGNSCAQQYSISFSSAEAGYYANLGCYACPAGTYKDQVGTSYSLCKKCPYGVYNGTSLVDGQSAAGTTSSSGCYIMGENIPTQTDTSGTFVSGGGICNWTGGSEPKFGICIDYIVDESKCVSALQSACSSVLNAGQGSPYCAADIWNRAHLTDVSLSCQHSSNADLAMRLQYINATPDQIHAFASAIAGENKCGLYISFVVFQY